MYFKEAINRINKIEYDKFGENSTQEDGLLGYEYLRRLAIFFSENGIKPLPPLVANIAKLLGDDNKILLQEYFTDSVVQSLNINIYNKYIIEYYLQLAKYAEYINNYAKYLSVYEPLIHIYERGGLFIMRHNELEVCGSGRFPLGSWYEDFLKKPAKDIDSL